MVKKCWVCGRPVFSIHSMFCRTHARIAFRIKERRFPPKAVKGLWEYFHEQGQRCYYCDVLLDTENIKSPWFLVFDHVIPLDPNRVMPACALVNEIKSALAEGEFWPMVFQLDDNHREGIPLKRMRLAHWRAHYELHAPHWDKERTMPIEGLKAQPKWKGKHKKCCLCGREVFSLQSKYCLRCSHFAKRLELKKFNRAAVRAILAYVRRYGFVCYYTGLPLETTNPQSPWYAVFNYLTPGDTSKVVLTFALFGEMKSDLSIQDFWYYIRQLADHKRKHATFRKKTPAHWYRLLQQRLRRKSY